jgi:hypothetical protein
MLAKFNGDFVSESLTIPEIFSICENDLKETKNKKKRMINFFIIILLIKKAV